MIRTSILGYQVFEQLYESNHSLIYRGHQENDNHPVILKLLKADYPTPIELTQFRQEYKITSSLNLPGTVRSYTLEKYQNTLILILEDFGGRALKTLIVERQLTLEEFLAIAIKIAEALAEVHTANIIHKDINPSNIVFNPTTGQLKIIDFGISTILSQENPTIQNPDVLEGTLAYLSPEQTGRMNRRLDYRTDFYSLGATFYELLTQQLPFETNDRLELVHCHIAKHPTPPHQLKPEIPLAISKIVMKLLAKTAEDRYQSAWGIRSDLVNCLMQLETNGKIGDIAPGENDISEKFQIPQKLYGREQEIEILLATFDRVSDNRKQDTNSHHRPTGIEMVLVSGYSGVGKSALVQEIYKPITQKRGYFISGKFDQLQRDIPYAAIIKAFQKLVQQILTENETKLANWKEKILAALGPNGQVIIDVIPEVELILGKQQPIALLNPSEAQNRFRLTFQNFIKVFTQPEHPLVIFLDDLQWADTASLQLIQFLIATSKIRYLFLIGAYRDNEVSATHPLISTLEEIRNSGAAINEIFLNPLNFDTVNQLLSETLNSAPDKTKSLAKLILAKTDGNPFFMNEFLKSLYTNHLLQFDSKNRCWQWNLDEIKAQEMTDNVVELMAKKIQKLSSGTQQQLHLAACIGNQFQLETLAVVAKQSQREAALSLREAISEGLIFPLNNAYKSVELDIGDTFSFTKTPRKNSIRPNLASDLLLTSSPEAVEYKFSHDRIQQAAYSLISDSEKKSIHCKIGQILLEQTPVQQQEEKIFDIVNHLNSGIELIRVGNQFENPKTDLTERAITNKPFLTMEELAQLNFVAGQKAKASTAYEPAFKYFSFGVELLGSQSWQTQYNLTLSLSEAAAEAAYLSGDFEQMEQFVNQVLQQAKTTLDTVKVHEVKIQAHIAQSQSREAVNTALPLLKKLGLNFPAKPTKLNILLSLVSTKFILARKKVKQLIDLPEMTDPVRLAAIRILSRISSAAYNAVPELMPLIVFKQVNLPVKYGNTALSAFAYAGYGVVLCGVVGDIESGYQFGQLALSVLSKFNAKAIEAKTIGVVSSLIRPWKEHWQDTLEPLKLAYQKGLETGDLEFAARTISVYFTHAYLLGKELSTLEKEIDSYNTVVNQLKQGTSFNRNSIYRQAILNLANCPKNPWHLDGKAYKEKVSLPLHQKTNDRNLIFHFYFNKLILCYLFREYAMAVENADLAEQYLDGVTSSIVIIPLYFYGSLARLAIYESVNSSERNSLLKKVKFNQKKIKKWADFGPMNCLHKFYLVEAEQQRLLGQSDSAAKLYDRAVELAKEHDYIHELALANELAANFYLSQDRTKFAQVYLQEARYYYLTWGATTKVETLDKQYSKLFASNTYSMQKGGVKDTKVTTTPTRRQSVSFLDLDAVIKASQAISSEIVLEKLLGNLMNILIENAGAEKGCLILPKDGQLTVQAEASIEATRVDVMPSTFLDSYQSLPKTLIQYVARTHSDVVLGDAANEEQFINDPYIAQQKVKSVLCTPILNQGKLVGILYLENNLTTDTFTPNRIEVLKLLSSQASVSLENAILYASLEQKVLERTQELNDKNIRLEQTLQELKRTQTQLIQTEKMSGLGQMVAGVAHEINNPISFIYGNLDHASEYCKDLLSLLAAYQQEYPTPTDLIQNMVEEIDLDFLKEDWAKLIDSMQTGADRIRKIVMSLRNFSRLDESDMKQVDIHPGIDNTLLLLQHRLQPTQNRPGIEIIKEYNCSSRIACYASQINQVFMNILNNAIDALDLLARSEASALENSDRASDLPTEQPDCLLKPTIRIRTAITPADTIIISIADNGVGMSEEVKKRIFDPFFTTKPVGSGTGLGLSICYQIVVDKHGGQLYCSSSPGHGSDFSIEIPRQS